jgi:5'-3' exoribonuclease 1
MGIPYFFKALTDRHRDLIVPWRNQRVNRLFLDYNCLIHQCANFVAATPCYRDIDLYNMVIQSTLMYTQQVIQMVNPQTIVYIAVDGPCPRAKMQQQRKRRYLAAWRSEMFPTEQQHHLSHQQPVKWDRNVVSPGTEFMHLLMHHLTVFTNQQNMFRMQHAHHHAKPPLYMLSTSNEFGEGEHKIFHYLDSNLPNHISQIDMVYGLDADLILLSLLRSNHNIMLLRETQNFHNSKQNSPFLLFNVTRLRHYINIPILDYVVLCSLIGNDFIPPLSYLKIKDNGLDQIINAYHSSKVLIQSDLVVNNLINIQLLASILRELAKSEQVLLKEAVDKLAKTHFDRADPEAYPLYQPQPFDLDDPQWRSNWYHYLLGKFNSNTIKTACKEYLNGVIWTLKYYTSSEDIDYSWHYQFNYSPTISDLAVYTQTTDKPYELNAERHQTFVTNITPWFQQLLIMPPKAFTPQQTLLSSKLPHCYPCRFGVGTFLKRFLWECGIIVPEIDFEKILAEYNKKKIN